MNEQINDTINKMIQNNKELKSSIGEMNTALNRLGGALRVDIDKQVEDAYQQGFEDGKAVYDKGCEECKYEGNNNKINSPCIFCSNNFKNQWQAKKTDDKIEVGDEVIYNNTMKCLVVRPETDERYAVLIDSNGSHHSADHRECKKTGRHFDIASILKEMQS